MDGYSNQAPISGGTPATSTYVFNPTAMEKADATSLIKDAVSVIVQDSIRRGEFVAEPKLVASYTVANAIYYLWSRQYLLPWFSKNITPQYADAVAKTVNNSVATLITARAFGGRITLTNSIITSAGAESLRLLGESMIQPENVAYANANSGYQ